MQSTQAAEINIEPTESYEEHISRMAAEFAERKRRL